MHIGVVYSIHLTIDSSIRKYGSFEKSPQYPVIERFAEEGRVTVFTRDKNRHEMPEGVSHVTIPNRLMWVMFSWLIIGLYSLRDRHTFNYYLSAGSILSLPFANRFTSAVLFYPCMFWSSSQNHSVYHTSMKERIFRRIESFLLRYVDYMIVGSMEIDRFVRHSSFNGHVLPWGKGIRLYDIDLRYERDYSKVLFAGWLNRIKNPDVLVTAWVKYVQPMHPEATLVICGDGELFKELSDRCKDNPNITLKGQCYDMNKEYNEAGIFVNCSAYDASPDSIVEAMSTGLPVIATNVGGNPDYVSKANGIITDSSLATDLADAINWMIEHPLDAKKKGNIGYEIAHKRHDLDAMLDNILGLFRRGD
jgi:glycosyltransferase involved in cell wall biosynthesis